MNKVVDIIIYKKFLWIKYPSKIIYFIVPSDLEERYCTYENLRDKNYRWGYHKDEMTTLCNYENLFSDSPKYKVFLDGNERFFICQKCFDLEYYIKSKNNEPLLSDCKDIIYHQKFVVYKPLTYYPGRLNFISITPFNEDLESLRTGFETLEEACNMLKDIKLYEKEEYEKEYEKNLFEKRHKFGIPIEC